MKVGSAMAGVSSRWLEQQRQQRANSRVLGQTHENTVASTPASTYELHQA